MRLIYPLILATAILPPFSRAFILSPTQPMPPRETYLINSTIGYITSMPLSSSSPTNKNFVLSSTAPKLVMTMSPTSTVSSNISAYCIQQCKNALASCYAVCSTPECPDVPCNPAHCKDDCDEWFGATTLCVKNCVQDPGVLVTYPFPSATGGGGS